MNRNGNLNIINEFYSKCYKQKQDITDSINEVLRGVHDIRVIEKVKNDILEKIENFEQSVRMMEREVNQYVREDDKIIWKKKTENMRLSYSTLKKDLDETVILFKKKQKGTNLFLKNSNNYSNINNLCYLEEEHTSLKSSMRIGSDIEKQAMYISDELNEQKDFLNKIKAKVNNIYNKLQISDTITRFLIRRGRSDTYLCIFLGFLTIIIIYYVYFYVKPKFRSNKFESTITG